MENRPILPQASQPSQPVPSLVEVEGGEPQFNMVGALLGGLVAALAGAALWGIVVAATGWQIGYFAIFLGVMVGAAVRFGGRGVSFIHGLIAAAFALFGVVLGTFLATAARVMDIRNASLLEMFSPREIGFVVNAITRNFEAVELLFYALAVYTAFSAAFREGRARRR